MMKLLTLNTHSLVEADYGQKLRDFVSAVCEIRPDIIALQEVSQSLSAPVFTGELQGYFQCISDVTLREDNHALVAAEMLRQRGSEYYWTWLPIKLGYGRYNEGIALLSRSPIISAESLHVSRVDDPMNWKTRKLLGVRTQQFPEDWFYCVHYGWWSDTDEPFSFQWQQTLSHVHDCGRTWLMGDFNSPADIRGEGYDLMLQSGFHDTYTLAERRDSGITVSGGIDGWHGSQEDKRIDLILCSEKVDVQSSEVVFNGIRQPVVSDHYGVLINVERSSI